MTSLHSQTSRLTGTPTFRWLPRMKMRDGEVVVHVVPDLVWCAPIDDPLAPVAYTDSSLEKCVPDLQDPATVGILWGCVERADQALQRQGGVAGELGFLAACRFLAVYDHAQEWIAIYGWAARAVVELLVQAMEALPDRPEWAIDVLATRAERPPPESPSPDPTASS